MQFIRFFIKSAAILIAIIFSASTLFAQKMMREDIVFQKDTLNTLKAETTLNMSEDLGMNALDTLSRIVTDTLSVKDSLSMPVVETLEDSVAKAKNDSILAAKSMLKIPVFSTAKDSIIEDFTGGKKMIYYYGETTVTYGDMELTAEYMQYDVDKQLLYAAGVADTTGKVKGKPVMTQGGNKFTMDNVFYNFKTMKSRIKNMETEEQDGLLRGDNLNMQPDKSINISGGKYTVCELEHPHYYLKMTKARIETKPKQKTVFGPAYLVLADVPLPLFLPFGFVPKHPERTSGILFPTFGEEAARGLFMRDGGFYFVIGDYLDIALTGSYYTKGSWNAKLTTRYKLRYKFNGSLDLSYSNDQTGDKGSPDFFQTKNFEVRWSHTQDSKANPGTSFRASVNFSSPSNNRFNAPNVNEALQNQISSSISYSKSWKALSLSINGLHNQNSRDSSYSITLPNITLNVNRFYPFKRKNRVGKAKWYEDFALSYNTTFQNKINFKMREIHDPDFWKKLQAGMTHNFSIGLPTFTLLKYITFSPSVSYGMNWYFSSQNQYYNPETDKLEVERTNQFGDFGVSQKFSAGISMSTRIYGLFNFRKGKLKAIRHMITPSLSASFAPEMGTRMNGWREYSYTDIKGVDHTVQYNKWAGGLNSPPSPGKSASLSFSIGNNLEAKIVDKKDTSGTGTKKVKLLDQLNISGSYNFLADSMRLSNISISANTNILNKVGINANISLDPYAVDYQGKRYGAFNVTRNPHLFRLTRASVSASFSISGDGKGKGNDGTGGKINTDVNASPYTRVYNNPVTGEYIPEGWLYYMNPDVPWSLSFSYTYGYSRSYQYTNEQLITKHNHTQTLSVSGQIKLTKALNINVSTGIDLTQFRLTTTQLSASYDLHCFQITFSWVPMGKWSQWSFRINAKSAALADLLQYRKTSSYWDKH